MKREVFVYLASICVPTFMRFSLSPRFTNSQKRRIGKFIGGKLPQLKNVWHFSYMAICEGKYKFSAKITIQETYHKLFNSGNFHQYVNFPGDWNNIINATHAKFCNSPDRSMRLTIGQNSWCSQTT